jgi:hypothetical protein
MSEWEIVGREQETVEAIINPLVDGAVPYIYTMKHLETGETRKVIAYNETELGEKIENGEFYD